MAQAYIPDCRFPQQNAPDNPCFLRLTPHGPRLVFEVSFGMSRNIFSLHGPAVLVAGTASLLFLTGCVGDMPGHGGWVADSHNKKVQRAYALMEVPRFAVAPVPVVVKPSPAVAAKPVKPKTPHPAAQHKPRRR